MDRPRARSEPPDDDLRALFRGTAPEVTATDLEALFARADSPDRARHRPFQRRLIMTIRIAAAGLLAAGAAALLIPRETSAAFDLADVERQVTTTQTVTLTQDDLLNGKPRHSMRMLVSGPNLVRSEFDDGYSVSDFKAKKVIIVDTKRKHATVLEGTAIHSYEPMNFYSLFRDIAKNPTKTLPEREVDGRPAVGFVVTVHGHEGTVWVDARSKLPVRVEQTIEQGKDVVEQVMRDIVFDRPLDESLFRLTPPEGYEVETRGVESLAAEPEDKSLAAPTIVPGVGLGPARFGMTTEDVIRTLGKPDRESTEGKPMSLSYYSRGFELTILPPEHPRHGLSRASCFGQHGLSIQVREFRGKTDRGLGLGATRAEIVEAYGPPDIEHVSRMKDVFGKNAANPESPTGQTEVQFSKLGLSFTLYNDKVYQIGIEAPRPAPAAKK
jgi:outer membrane lipoprotein-sorting protein